MKKILLLILPIIFLLTGCYDYSELNDLAIGSAIGIDYIDNNYQITVQIMNLEKEKSDVSQESSIIYKGTGKTIAEAIRNISLEYPKKLYLGHIELMVLGKDILNYDIGKILDYFTRDTQIILEFSVIASKEFTAYEILNQRDIAENFASQGIVSSLQNASKINGKITDINFEEFTATYLEKGIDSIISNVSIIENTKSTAKDNNNNNENIIDTYNTIKLENLLVVKNGKLVTELSSNASIAYNIIQNNIHTLMVNEKFYNEYITVEVTNPKADINLSLKDNIIVEININLRGIIIQFYKEKFNKSTKLLNEISNIIEKDIEEKVLALIDECKNNNIDVLGLKNFIYKNYNKEYKTYKNKNIYQEAIFKINSKVNVFNTGDTYHGIDK